MTDPLAHRVALVTGGAGALGQAVTSPHGITVNSILPSTMDTAANRAAMPDSDRAGWVPVASVADAIAFLVQDESAHLTGALLTI